MQSAVVNISPAESSVYIAGHGEETELKRERFIDKTGFISVNVSFFPSVDIC
jgi:hypothetical protein